ncbi:Plasma membrane proteolipid 3 [Cyberlindnera fabianii]|uniref:Plasma membrane proteolipid 3 n=1 Tax=Cyberlindnera fabianii TaxID=36022 RepID=A0A1V2L508_CYBFA|nr:Plasma membrane proteolipid 3 [Cyberlindnera fabianii]
MVDSAKIINVIIALLLPPLAVFMVRGAGRDLLINIVLCSKYPHVFSPYEDFFASLFKNNLHPKNAFTLEKSMDH